MGTLLTSWLTAGMCTVVAFKETVNMESPSCYIQNPFSEAVDIVSDSFLDAMMHSSIREQRYLWICSYAESR